MPSRRGYSSGFKKRGGGRRFMPYQTKQTRSASFMAARRRSGRGSYNRNVGLRNARTGGLLGLEVKYLDVPVSNVALTAPIDGSGGELQPTSIVTGCLSAPAQGDGPTNRDGKKIIIKSCLFQGTIVCANQTAQSAADTVPEIFLALVMDKQTNGVTINSEDIFVNPVANGANAAQPFRNMSNTNRFQVLKQWTKKLAPIALANDAAATGNLVQTGQSTVFNLSYKGNIPVNFTTGSTTADVAGVVDNSIHLVGYCSNISLAPTVYGSMRIRFIG